MTTSGNLKYCKYCNITKSPDFFPLKGAKCKACIKSYMSEYYSINKSKLNSQSLNNANYVRNTIFRMLGHRCASCSQSELELLTVDHIYADRKLERSLSSITWKRDIIRGISDISKYQILCRNCNDSKQRLNPVQLLKHRTPMGKKKTCSGCNIIKDVSNFSTSSYRGKKCVDSTCSLCTRFRLMIVTLQCYELLGGHCVHCNESNPSMLSIDHVHDDGYLRRQMGEPTGGLLCRKILNGDLDLEDFQLLCSNCNYRKMRKNSNRGIAA